MHYDFFLLISQVDLLLLKYYLFSEKAEENAQRERLNSKIKVDLGSVKMKVRFNFDDLNLNENVIQETKKKRNGWKFYLCPYSPSKITLLIFS